MLRIAICDDESSARDALFIKLERILDEKTEKVVYAFSSGTGAVRWLKKHPGEIDLLFLDVEMEGLSGIETAKQIRTFDENLAIVFVTGYPDFVFEGYRVGALDYLIKPIKEKRLEEVINRVRNLLKSTKQKQFAFQNADGIYRFYKKEIQYFYSERRKVTIVAKGQKNSFYAKLNDVQKQLGDGFVRIHQRYLVNAEAVEQIQSSSVMIGGENLPVSRSLKDAATSELAKALLGGISE